MGAQSTPVAVNLVYTILTFIKNTIRTQETTDSAVCVECRLKIRPHPPISIINVLEFRTEMLQRIQVNLCLSADLLFDPNPRDKVGSSQ